MPVTDFFTVFLYHLWIQLPSLSRRMPILKFNKNPEIAGQRTADADPSYKLEFFGALITGENSNWDRDPIFWG